MNKDTDYSEKLVKILNEAKKDDRKGKHYVYEEYKSQLSEIPMTAREYEQAIYALAKSLNV